MRSRLINLAATLTIGMLGSQAVYAAAELPTRSSSQSAVTVSATPRAFSGATWDFELAFNTHSGSLDDDPSKTTTLSTDLGKAFSPIKWLGDPAGGHHRKGVLQFNPITPRPTTVELRMTRPGEAQPRLFKWQLGNP